MKLTNKVLPIIILILGLSGCSEFLDDEIQFTPQEVVTESRERSRGLINDIYQNYEYNYFSDFTTEYLTDNAVLNSSDTNLATGYWGPTDNPFSGVWQQSYNNIRQVYQYIELVHNENLPFLLSEEDAEENQRVIDRYYGEAFFLKAFAEWELLQIYGGLSADGDMLGFPIVNGILENQDYASLTRNTYDECVAQINADLDIAIESLPLFYSGTIAGYNTEETGRASGLAAYALKAKVALYAASPAFNPTNDISKWITAADYAREFIEVNGGLKPLQAVDYSREDNPDHIWRMRNTRSNSNLEISLYPPTLYGQGQVNPSQNLIDAFPSSNGYPISTSESLYDASAPYASRDSRFYKFIFYNNDQCLTSELCEDYSPLQIFQGGRDNYGGFIQEVGTRTGYYLKKFLNKLDLDPSALDATTTLPRVYVQLGLTDLYLGYAEALNEAYGPNDTPGDFTFSAKEVLATVRQRAGYFIDPYLDTVSNDANDFRNLVKTERRIELCFSGQRFHDLRRWKDIINIEDIKGVSVTKNADDSFTFDSIDVERRVYEDKNYYLPLPYAELLLNTNLKQNQGW